MIDPEANFTEAETARRANDGAGGRAMTHEKEVKALQQQVRALKTMLRAVQWSGKGTGGGAGYCPTCKR